MSVRLSTDTLGSLSMGAAKLIIERAIDEAIADIDDRGEDRQARKVVIQLDLKRRPDGLIETSVAAQAKLPPRKTASTVAKVSKRAHRGPQLSFESMSPDNPQSPRLRTRPKIDPHRPCTNHIHVHAHAHTGVIAMLKELFESILSIGAEQSRIQLLKPESEPAHKYVMVDKSDTENPVEWIDADPEPREHAAGSVEDLVAFAKHMKTTDAEACPVIWYDRTGVVLLCDDYTRRDKVTFALSYSPQLAAVQKLENRQWMSQKDLVFLLRTTFAKCLGSSGNLIDIIRNVKFQVNEQGGAEIRHGKESIGRSLQAQLTGEGSIPEYVTLQVPVFLQASCPWIKPIRCALEPDPKTQQFMLLTLPGEIEEAISSAEDSLAEDIGEHLGAEGFDASSGEGIPVYQGAP